MVILTDLELFEHGCGNIFLRPLKGARKVVCCNTEFIILANTELNMTTDPLKDPTGAFDVFGDVKQ